MLYTLVVILHVFVCFLMIGAILLQSGKGAEIGASFGGSAAREGTMAAPVTAASAAKWRREMGSDIGSLGTGEKGAGIVAGPCPVCPAVA